MGERQREQIYKEKKRERERERELKPGPSKRPPAPTLQAKASRYPSPAGPDGQPQSQDDFAAAPCNVPSVSVLVLDCAWSLSGRSSSAVHSLE